MLLDILKPFIYKGFKTYMTQFTLQYDTVYLAYSTKINYCVIA